MDVHKKTITIAIADAGSREPARVYGTINNDFEALNKFCRKSLKNGHARYVLSRYEFSDIF
jgi:hypothetical protein